MADRQKPEPAPPGESDFDRAMRGLIRVPKYELAKAAKRERAAKRRAAAKSK
ncbi:MAG: hypothetical protein KJZ68_03605 [Phycisphaerales bacterium]|nr:hypothetical protein [Phycisphaerales bacterium]